MNHSSKLHFLAFLSLILVLAVSAPRAHATPITSITYGLTGVSTSAGALTGTVTIDSGSQQITAANITFNRPGVDLFTFTSVNSPAAWNGLGQAWIAGTDSTPSSSAQIALFYDTANIGSGNLALCFFNGPVCGGVGVENSLLAVYYPGGFTANITAGSLNPASAPNGSLNPAVPTTTVPEPVSLALLGTGIFGLALFGRFKVFRSREDTE